MSNDFDSVINLLRAAGEATRLRIVALLTNGEMVAQEITAILGQSQPRVSNHLKQLHEAGLIEKRSEGSWVFHKLSDAESPKRITNLVLEMLGTFNHQIELDKRKFFEIRQKREEQAKSYFEKVAPEWETLRALHQPEKGVEEALLNLIKGEKFNLHLDLGAGLGSILECLQPYCVQSEGIDRSHQMLAIARFRTEKYDGKIRLRHGDILHLPHLDQSADLVSIHQVLHYLDDPMAAIKEASRVLKTNGVLLIAEFAPHKNEELRTDFGHKRLGLAPQDIVTWCKNNGFEEAGAILVSDENKKDHKEALKVNVMKFVKNATNIKIDAPITKRKFA